MTPPTNPVGIFVFYSNWDGACFEVHQNPFEVEAVLTRIKAMEDANENGTKLLAVVQGRALEYETVEVAKVVKLKG